jgi:hypothetical protein
MRYPHLVTADRLLSWAGTLVQRLDRDAAEVRQQGDCTLAVSPATTTTVSATGCRVGARVFLQARTASAAAASARVTSVADGSFVITHTAGAGTDQHFWYSIHV